MKENNEENKKISILEDSPIPVDPRMILVGLPLFVYRDEDDMDTEDEDYDELQKRVLRDINGDYEEPDNIPNIKMSDKVIVKHILLSDLITHTAINSHVDDDYNEDHTKTDLEFYNGSMRVKCTVAMPKERLMAKIGFYVV